MSLFKCKMCGGSLEITGNETVAECEYCGTKQTLPGTRDDAMTNLFNRANNLRMKCEFDKALQLYEKIIEQYDSEAEAHWGAVLCKYGIEYVEDPKTLTRIPTCHRTSFDAVTKDADYLAAIDYSDTLQQAIYEQEARAIDRIQRDILAVVEQEKPFDVFICYKETDENGKRTVDSTIANDIYYQLTQEGFKVFYAAITLEDKLGQEYEPYIFAALNSAKVMLVLGTKPEYFNAVWVKNEWSRYLKLMKSDRQKLLIPCYRDMDAYDLPEEFAHLQSQDMSKIGFINDVVRGIKKVVQKDEPVKAAVVKETVVTGGNANTETLLKRISVFVADGEWEKADEYCERLLDTDPDNKTAYYYKFLTYMKSINIENISILQYITDETAHKLLAHCKTEISEQVNRMIQETPRITVKNPLNGIRCFLYDKITDCFSTQNYYNRMFADFIGNVDRDGKFTSCEYNIFYIYCEEFTHKFWNDIHFSKIVFEEGVKKIHGLSLGCELCDEIEIVIPDSLIELGPIIIDDRTVGTIKYSLSPTNSNFKLINGTLYSGDQSELIKFSGKEENCVIPDTVKIIKIGAFEQCSLISATIPDSVTTIEDRAFRFCLNLTSITILNGVTKIGNRAFELCAGLKFVSIPESVVEIGEDIFSQCEEITSVLIPTHLENSPNYPFGIKNVNIIETYTGSLKDHLNSVTTTKISHHQEKLKAAEAEKNRLVNLQEIYPQVEQTLKDLESEYNDCKKRITKLKNERGALGFFDKKRKKEIDDELSELQQKMGKYNVEIENLESQISVYASIDFTKTIDKLDKEIELHIITISELEKQLI